MAQANFNKESKDETTVGDEVFPVEEEEGTTLHIRKPARSVREEDEKDFKAAKPAALTRQATHGEQIERNSEEMLVEEGGEEGSEESGDAVSPLSKKKRGVSTKDFQILCVIGMGAYGKVLQVKNKTNRKVYAMKVISKKLLQKKNHIAYMQAERDIMTKVDHPFVVGLKCSFQTPDKMFLIMDYMPGGELFFHLDKEGFILEDTARFYAAELVLALEFLHSINIIHRDLKPENILIDGKGHIKVTDFGLAKEFSSSESSDDGTRTVCGTYEYMAPEMISKKGYSKAVDWWSLGTLMYEMMTGKPPFRGKNKENLMKRILTEKIKFPHWLSGEATSIMKAFLERNVQKRLGAQKSTMFKVGGTQAIKEHKFFTHARTDWHAIEDLQVRAPIVPEIESVTDTSYFHEDFTTMELPRSLSFESNMSLDVAPPDDAALHLYKGFSFIHPGWDQEQMSPVGSLDLGTSLSSSPGKNELATDGNLAVGPITSPRAITTKPISPRASGMVKPMGSIKETSVPVSDEEERSRSESNSFTKPDNQKRENGFRFLSMSSGGTDSRHVSCKLDSSPAEDQMQFQMEDLTLDDKSGSLKEHDGGAQELKQDIHSQLPAQLLKGSNRTKKPTDIVDQMNFAPASSLDDDTTAKQEHSNSAAGQKYRGITKKQHGDPPQQISDPTFQPPWGTHPPHYSPPHHFAEPPPGFYPPNPHHHPFFDPFHPPPPMHPHMHLNDPQQFLNAHDLQATGNSNGRFHSKIEKKKKTIQKNNRNVKNNPTTWKNQNRNQQSTTPITPKNYPPLSSTRNIVDFPPMPGSDFPPMSSSNANPNNSSSSVSTNKKQPQPKTSWSNVVSKKTDYSDFPLPNNYGNMGTKNKALRPAASEWTPNATATEWKPPSSPW